MIVIYCLSFFFSSTFLTEPRFREETTQVVLLQKKKKLDKQLLLAGIQALQFLVESLEFIWP